MGAGMQRAFAAAKATRTRKPRENRQCPHGEPLGRCSDCVREHNEATR